MGSFKRGELSSFRIFFEGTRLPDMKVIPGQVFSFRSVRQNREARIRSPAPAQRPSGQESSAKREAVLTHATTSRTASAIRESISSARRFITDEVACKETSAIGLKPYEPAAVQPAAVGKVPTAIKEFGHWHHLNEVTIEAGKTPSDSEINFEATAWNRINRALAVSEGSASA
jgi:hypothetical protein